ncbi:MAG: hypothetical protein CMN58_07045 [Solibacterales bacterium]|nr:hypothetical protein [Bryobacterales bacterium]
MRFDKKLYKYIVVMIQRHLPWKFTNPILSYEALRISDPWGGMVGLEAVEAPLYGVGFFV